MLRTQKKESIIVSALRARTNFGRLLRQVDEERRSLVIEKRGIPRAVLLSIRDYVRLAAPAIRNHRKTRPLGCSGATPSGCERPRRQHIPRMRRCCPRGLSRDWKHAPFSEVLEEDQGHYVPRVR